MPGEDGLQLIREVRELDAARGRTTPAAAFTALARSSDRRDALERGLPDARRQTDRSLRARGRRRAAGERRVIEPRICSRRAAGHVCRRGTASMFGAGRRRRAGTAGRAARRARGGRLRRGRRRQRPRRAETSAQHAHDLPDRPRSVPAGDGRPAVPGRAAARSIAGLDSDGRGREGSRRPARRANLARAHSSASRSTSTNCGRSSVAWAARRARPTDRGRRTAPPDMRVSRTVRRRIASRKRKRGNRDAGCLVRLGGALPTTRFPRSA